MSSTRLYRFSGLGLLIGGLLALLGVADFGKQLQRTYHSPAPGLLLALPQWAICTELSTLDLVGLCRGQREILDLITQGYKNAEIAQQLVLSEKTVRNHVSNILSKLQVTDRAQAIIRAKDAGLG